MNKVIFVLFKKKIIIIIIIIIINFFYVKQTRSYQKHSLPLSSGAKLLMHMLWICYA